MKNKILIGIISMILFIIGLNYYQDLQHFLLSFIPDLVVQYKRLFTQISQSIFFGFTLSIIPILSYILWSKFKIEKNRNKFYIVLSFVISSIIALTVKTRILKLKTQPFTDIILSQNENEINVGKPLYEGESLNFTLYIFVAEIFTFIIIYLILNKNNTKNRSIN